MQQALVFLVSLLKRKGLLEMFYGIRIWLKIGTASTKHAEHLPPHNISAFFSFLPFGLQYCTGRARMDSSSAAALICNLVFGFG